MDDNVSTQKHPSRLPEPVPTSGCLRPASSNRIIDAVWLIIASRILLFLSLATSCLVLLSWLAGWSEFQSLISGLPTMKFNTALAFTLLSGSGLLGSLTYPGRRARTTADLLIMTALAIAVANLIQHFADVDLGIDTLFCADPASLVAGTLPGRMSYGPALGITLICLGILLDKNGAKRFSQVCLILGGLIGAIAIVNFIRQISWLHNLEIFSTTALHTAILFCFLAVSLLVQQKGWRIALQSVGCSDLKAKFHLARGMIAVVSATLLIGLLVTAGFVIDSQMTIKRESRERFLHLSERVAINAQKQINLCIYGLKGARGVYAASKSVERKEFKAYVESCDLSIDFPGTRGVGFIKRVLRQDIDAFVAAERADDAPDFSVRTSGNAPDLFVIQHIYPLESNLPTWGFDIGSESVRRAAAERAIQSGEPTLSESIALLQDQQKRRGFLYFVPVYKNGTNPKTPEEREAALEGLAYSPIVAEEVLSLIRPFVDGELDFELFEGNRLDQRAKLYDDDGHLSNVEVDEQEQYAGREFSLQTPLNIGGLDCLLVTSTTPVFDAKINRDSPVIIAIGGILMSLMLAAIVWSLGLSRARAIDLSETITQDLRDSESEMRLAVMKSERLAEIARRTSNAVIITDVEGKIEWVNDGFTRITGYQLEEVIGKKPGSILQGEKSDPAVTARLGAAVRKGEPAKAAIVNYGKDGREYTLDIEIEPLRDAHGVINGFMAIESDITERIQQEQLVKESERFARSTVDSLAAHLAILDESGEIIAVNRAWRQFAQDNQPLKSDVCEGKNYLAVYDASQAYHSAEAGAVAAGIRTVMRGEQEEFSLEYPCHAPNERRWFIVRVTRFAGEGPVHVVVVHENITQRKLSEIELEKASKRANDASHAKSEFLANMSHEIRTPLTAIMGFTELLAEDGDGLIAPAQRVEAISTIRRASEHLLTVVNDILDLSKIEAGQMSVERVDTDLADLLGGVVSLMKPRANSKGLTLDVEFETPIPSRTMSDPTRLRQVLLNLLGNAVKFTEEGGIIMRVSIEKQDEREQLLRIAIHDTGPGLTPVQQQRLFAAFSQADSTVTRKHGGSGLGLVICRRLAQLMGGQVELTATEPGKGSVFTVSVLMGQIDGVADTSTAGGQVLPNVAAVGGNAERLSGRILLAEDGPDNQRLISIILMKAGAQVDIAENGQIALRMLERANAVATPYDIVITDMQMPVMDGYTLARSIRERGWQLPVVVLTANAMPEERQRCIDAGCNDFNTKPINKQSLLKICRHWMSPSVPCKN